MRAKVLSVATAMVLILTAVAPVGAITDGQLDVNGHPSVGALVFEPAPGVKEFICSGTLVAPKVYVTAAHCIEFLVQSGVAPHDVWVTFDPVFAQTGTFHRGTYHSNPAFGGPGVADPHDLAVIVLDAPPGITPAQLPSQGYLDTVAVREQTFTAVGYGATRTGKTTGPHAISFDGQRRVATQSGLSLRKAWFLLSMNPSTGNGGTCYGDSGGPHFVGATTIVVSITVTGDAVCRATDQTYRIDTQESLDFIRSFIL